MYVVLWAAYARRMIYRHEDRVTTIERRGPGGVTILITESPAGRPRWTIDYYPSSRSSREAPAFTDDSQTAHIPEELEDVLTWAKRRWDDYLLARRAA